MKYLIATDRDIHCWVDSDNYYLSSIGLHVPFYVRQHTYDIPIQHIKLGELEGDGLALIHDFIKNKNKFELI